MAYVTWHPNLAWAVMCAMRSSLSCSPWAATLFLSSGCDLTRSCRERIREKWGNEKAALQTAKYTIAGHSTQASSGLTFWCHRMQSINQGAQISNTECYQEILIALCCISLGYCESRDCCDIFVTSLA